MLNHETIPHSFVCPCVQDLLYQNKLLKQQVVKLEQQLGLLAERIDEHDEQIDDAVRRIQQNESVMDGYENRYYEWECSPNYYSQDGDANCNF